MLQRGRPEREARRHSPYGGGKHFKSKRLAELHGGSASGPAPPVVGPNGEKLWNGDRERLHFKAATYDDVLADKGAPTMNAVAGREEYKCAQCNGYFPRKRDAVAAERTIDLDHHRNWAAWVMDKVDPRVFQDAGGHAWSAFFLDDVSAAYNDASNLVPMCSTHNRRKSGPRWFDKAEKPLHMPGCPACSAAPGPFPLPS